LYNALKKQGYDSLFTINARTLSSFVRGLTEDYAAEHDGAEGFPEWISGLVKSYDNIGITIKKSTKS
jgi:hypothetical protein